MFIGEVARSQLAADCGGRRIGLVVSAMLRAAEGKTEVRPWHVSAWGRTSDNQTRYPVRMHVTLTERADNALRDEAWRLRLTLAETFRAMLETGRRQDWTDYL